MSEPTDKTKSQIAQEAAETLVKNMKNLIKANEEILSTEKSYYEQLDRFYSIFIRGVLSDKTLMKNKDVQAFIKEAKKLEPLIELSKKILDELTTAWQKQEDVGHIFSKYTKELEKCFSNYAASHENLLTCFNKIKNIEGVQVLEKKLMKESDYLDVGDHLILPIQRSPRYLLLLQDIKKCTAALVSNDNPAFLEAEAALTNTTEVTKKINKFVTDTAAARMLNTCASECKPKVTITNIEKKIEHKDWDNLKNAFGKAADDSKVLKGLVFSRSGSGIDVKDEKGNVLLKISLKKTLFGKKKLTIKLAQDDKRVATAFNLEKMLYAMSEITHIACIELSPQLKQSNVEFKYNEKKMKELLKSETPADSKKITVALDNIKGTIKTILDFFKQAIIVPEKQFTQQFENQKKKTPSFWGLLKIDSQSSKARKPERP